MLLKKKTNGQIVFQSLKKNKETIALFFPFPMFFPKEDTELFLDNILKVLLLDLKKQIALLYTISSCGREGSNFYSYHTQ